jgi:glycosyltransferase involved in cell wall biosynthesis
MGEGTILYFGAFRLPDGNAAAQRVVGNARALRALGYRVVLVSMDFKQRPETPLLQQEHFGFESWVIQKDSRQANRIVGHFDARPYRRILEKYADVRFVILYNFPTWMSLMILRYCTARKIRTVADVTEWYDTKGRSLPVRIVKGLDSMFRMRIVNRRLDGLILISRWLMDYYGRNGHTVRIPPLIDLEDPKWENRTPAEERPLRFVFAGSASKQKERLDQLVAATMELHRKYPIGLDIIGITEERFQCIYGMDTSALHATEPGIVRFLGVVGHIDALGFVKKASHSLIIRNPSRLTNAGFPTKFVESVSCGTPVIVTDTSDLKEYVSNGRNGYLVSADHLAEELDCILSMDHTPTMERDRFDYRRYIADFQRFLRDMTKT